MTVDTLKNSNPDLN